MSAKGDAAVQEIANYMLSILGPRGEFWQENNYYDPLTGCMCLAAALEVAIADLKADQVFYDIIELYAGDYSAEKGLRTDLGLSTFYIEDFNDSPLTKWAHIKDFLASLKEKGNGEVEA